MTDATHATVQTLRRHVAESAAREQAFQSIIERGIGVIPGCVAGLWTFDRQTSELVIVHSFDSLGAAEAFAQFARNNADRQASFGLELISIRVTEVLGTA